MRPTPTKLAMASIDPNLRSAPERGAFSGRAIVTGSVLSLFLACAAPYGNMVIRGSYMALDFSTPGAIFLFFLLVGPLNGLMRVVHLSLIHI